MLYSNLAYQDGDSWKCCLSKKKRKNEYKNESVSCLAYQQNYASLVDRNLFSLPSISKKLWTSAQGVHEKYDDQKLTVWCQSIFGVEKNLLLIISGFRAKNCWTFGKTAFYMSRRRFWGILFEKKRYYKIFWTSRETFADFEQKFFGRVVETAFYVPRWTFWDLKKPWTYSLRSHGEEYLHTEILIFLS